MGKEVHVESVGREIDRRVGKAIKQQRRMWRAALICGDDREERINIVLLVESVFVGQAAVRGASLDAEIGARDTLYALSI